MVESRVQTRFDLGTPLEELAALVASAGVVSPRTQTFFFARGLCQCAMPATFPAVSITEDTRRKRQCVHEVGGTQVMSHDDSLALGTMGSFRLLLVP